MLAKTIFGVSVTLSLIPKVSRMTICQLSIEIYFTIFAYKEKRRNLPSLCTSKLGLHTTLVNTM